MGVNAQTAVPKFTAGQVLTAAQQTNINTGIPVFATTTTRDAAFGGSNKVLAEGQFAYIEATDTTQFYDGAAWQTVGASGLTLIKTQTIGSAVSSVAVTGVFSATYDNYKIIVNGGAGSTEANVGLTLGASATGYYAGGAFWQYPNTQTSRGDTNGTSWTAAASMTANSISADITLLQPFAAARTGFNAWAMFSNGTQYGGVQAGFHNVATSYTDFTLTAASGTMTGGTIRVYGYRNS